jgi:hypothetical protein
MGRLGLALMIATFTFLLVGQAVATPIGVVEIGIEADPIYDVVFRYKIINQSYGSDGDIKNVFISLPSALQSQVDMTYGTEALKTIETPSADWMSFDFPPAMTVQLVANPSSTGIVDSGIFKVGLHLITGSVIPHDPHQVHMYWSTGKDYKAQASIPEPTTLLLVGFGLIVVAGYARIRKKREV